MIESTFSFLPRPPKESARSRLMPHLLIGELKIENASWPLQPYSLCYSPARAEAWSKLHASRREAPKYGLATGCSLSGLAISLFDQSLPNRTCCHSYIFDGPSGSGKTTSSSSSDENRLPKRATRRTSRLSRLLSVARVSRTMLSEERRVDSCVRLVACERPTRVRRD
jgi:hypothetical protein